MMTIRVKGEGTVRLYGGSDHKINYNVTEKGNGIYCGLSIDKDIIISKDVTGDSTELRNNVESLVDCICNLMCVSDMGTNQNVFNIVIDLDNLIGHITRIGESAMLEKYGLHPLQNPDNFK